MTIFAAPARHADMAGMVDMMKAPWLKHFGWGETTRNV